MKLQFESMETTQSENPAVGELKFSLTGENRDHFAVQIGTFSAAAALVPKNPSVTSMRSNLKLIIRCEGNHEPAAVTSVLAEPDQTVSSITLAPNQVLFVRLVNNQYPEDDQRRIFDEYRVLWEDGRLACSVPSRQFS